MHLVEGDDERPGRFSRGGVSESLEVETITLSLSAVLSKVIFST